MNLDSITAQLNGLIDDSSFDMPVLALAAAALAFGCVMATVPKSLRTVGIAYGIAMGVVIHLHEMQYLYYGIFAGFAAAGIFRLVRPRKRANA